MITQYIQSTETRGCWTLQIRMTNVSGNFHRSCYVYYKDKHIAVCKTKKEAKEMIACGAFDRYI